MKKLLLLSSFCILSRLFLVGTIFNLQSTMLFSQNPADIGYQWANSIGSTDEDGDLSIAVDASGNVYIIGYFRGTADFDPGVGTTSLTPVGNSDIFFAKYDNNGNYLWAKSIGSTNEDEGRCIAVDASGNVYITGFFRGTADFNPDAGTANLTPVGNADIFFAKYNSSGVYQWAKKIGSTGNDYGNGLTVDASGNVYITGFFQSTADFDPGAGTANLTAVGGYDIFFAKYNSSGVYQWAKRIGSTSSDYGQSIAVDASDNVYITGYFNGTADFDLGAGTANLTPVGNSDIFFAKYNSSGVYQWAKSIGSTSSDQGNSIAVDASGNVYITGYFNGTADFDPGAGTANLTAVDSSDIFFAKYNSSGIFQWAKSIGSTGNDYGYSIAVDASGNTYISGFFRGTADFDPGAETANLAPVGSWDIYLAKYCQFSGTITTTGTNVSCFNEYDGSALVSVSGVITPPYTYLWSNGSSNDTITNLFAGVYTVTISDGNSCPVTKQINITQPLLLATATFISNPCEVNGGQASVSASGGFSPYTFLWSNNATTATVTGLSTGNYSATITDANGCTTASNIVTISNIPKPVNEICLITLDSAYTKNLITWEKPVTTGIDSFRIYRLIGAAYKQIGSVAYSSLSEFVDASFNISTYPARYKISVLDTCGNESALSPYHQTIFQQQAQIISGDVNLTWSLYVDSANTNYINHYNILRDDNGTGNFTVIDSTVPAFVTMYTDTTAPVSANIRYIIEGRISGTCNVTLKTKNYNSSLSNKTTINTLSVTELLVQGFGFEIIPNPTTGKFEVRSEKLEVRSIKIYNVFGQKVYEWEGKISSDKFSQEINLTGESQNIFFVEMMIDNKKQVKKVVKIE